MKIKNILVPIGGSVYSKNALHHAILFAKIFRAKITGVFVKDIRFFEGPLFQAIENTLFSRPYFEVLKEDIEASLDKRSNIIKNYFQQRCADEHIPYDFKIYKGLVSDIILKESLSADLVIMGKKGEDASWLQKRLGSSFTRVLHQAQKPLLVADEKETQSIQNILLCYSGGKYAEKGLQTINLLMKKMDLHLSVLTIGSKKIKAVEIQQQAKDYLESKGIKARYLFSAGKVEQEIFKVIKTDNIDMVIMGGSIKKSYEDYLTQCIVNRVLYDSKVPVLFIR